VTPAPPEIECLFGHQAHFPPCSVSCSVKIAFVTPEFVGTAHFFTPLTLHRFAGGCGANLKDLYLVGQHSNRQLSVARIDGIARPPAQGDCLFFATITTWTPVGIRKFVCRSFLIIKPLDCYLPPFSGNRAVRHCGSSKTAVWRRMPCWSFCYDGRAWRNPAERYPPRNPAQFLWERDDPAFAILCRPACLPRNCPAGRRKFEVTWLKFRRHLLVGCKGLA